MRETYQPPTTPAGPPHDRTPEETAPLSPSTEIDRMQRSATKTRARPRARGNGVPFPFSRYGLRPGRSRLGSPSFLQGLVIPALTHVILALTHVIPAKAGI